MNYEYVKTHYGVPAETGRRVRVYGKNGVISEDHGHYIGVNFDSDKPSVIKNAHPIDGVEYLGIGTIRKPSKGSARYRRFLEFDGGMSFIEFCYWDADLERSQNRGY